MLLVFVLPVFLALPSPFSATNDDATAGVRKPNGCTEISGIVFEGDYRR